MISVIVPVHNGEKTLCRCVDSILHSTEKDIEIILVENGSTDQTLSICRSYSEKYSNIRTIIADVTGLSHARNLGMDTAQGEWIAFVDADDYIAPTMYERFLKKAEADHNDFLFGEIVKGDSEDHSWENQEYKSENLSREDYCWNLFCIAQYKYSLVMNKLFSGSVIKQFRFDETLRYMEDREFVFRVLSKTTSIGYVPTPVYYYYQNNPTSISKSSGMETRIDQVRSLQKCLAFADTTFSEFPEYGDYISACLLQNAGFRKKRAIECGLPSQVEELEPIIRETAKRVRRAKHLGTKVKFRFLLEHDAPGLFHLVARILGKS